MACGTGLGAATAGGVGVAACCGDAFSGGVGLGIDAAGAFGLTKFGG